MMKRIAKALVGATGVVLVWRTRVLQVTAFALAARFRQASKRPRRSSVFKNLKEFHGEQQPAQPDTLNQRCLITYHPEYQDFDPDLAFRCLRAAASVGFGWVRTDVHWDQVIPDGRKANAEALGWYRSFLAASRNLGIKNMVVLSNPSELVASQSTSERLRCWKTYVETVTQEMGSLCDAFQLMNEPNNPVYRFFEAEDAAKALSEGAAIIHHALPKARVAINVSMEFWGWKKYLSTLLKRCGPSIDMVGLDHYPGTWTIGPPMERWADAVEVAKEIANASPDSEWHGRSFAIMETGYSTNTLCRDGHQQSAYFAHLTTIANTLKQMPLTNGLLLGIYELCDADSSAWVDPEPHFGLLTSELLPKTAAATVSQLIAFF